MPLTESEIEPEITESLPTEIVPSQEPISPTDVPLIESEIQPEITESLPTEVVSTQEPVIPTDLSATETEIAPQSMDPLLASATPTPDPELLAVIPTEIIPTATDVMQTSDILIAEESIEVPDPFESILFDPWYWDSAGNLHQFDSFSALIQNLKSDPLLNQPDVLGDRCIYVQEGTTGENISFEGFTSEFFKYSDLKFIGGCSVGTNVCQNITTLNGSLNFINSNMNLVFMNFIYGSQINLTNSSNVTLNVASNDPIIINDVSGNNSITIEDHTDDVNDAVQIKSDRVGGYDKVEIAADPIVPLISDEIRTTFSQESDTENSLTVHTQKVARLDISSIQVKDLTYKFNHMNESYSLQQSDNGKMCLVSVDYGTVRFSDPTESLTIKTTAMDSDFTVNSFNNDTFTGSLSILGESPRDDINIETDLLLKGKDLRIRGGKVTVKEGKTLSTRFINIGGTPNYEIAASIGDSGKILIEASDFEMKTGSKLLAHADSGYKGGSVTINAEDTNGWGVPAIDWLREKLGILIGSAQGIYVNGASVKLDSAIITGDSIKITAKSGYSISDKFAEDIAQVINGTGIGDFLSNLTGKTAGELGKTIGDLGIMNNGVLPIPIGINVRVSSSDIKLLGNTFINAVNAVNILADAINNSDLTVSSKLFSIGIVVAVTNSIVNITDESKIVSTNGDILIRSNAEGNATVTTGTTTKAENNKLPLSFAAGVSVLTSKAEIGEDTLIESGGSVNLIANGANIGGSNATVFLIGGGANAITLAVYTGISNVLAKADGTIIAKSSSTERSLIPINLADVNEITDTICIPNHGFTNGQQVIYRAADYQLPIPGLIDGEIYTIFVVDENNVRFVSAVPVNISSTGVTVDSTHSFIPYKPLVFNVSSESINGEEDVITIIGHGFMYGQKIRYYSLMEEPIGGLVDGTEYYVKRLDDDRFQLLSAAADTEPIPLTLPEGISTSQSFWYLDEGLTKTFIPLSSGSDNIDDANDTIYLPNHGYETGDLIYYRVPDGTVKRKVTLEYNFTVAASMAGTNTLTLLFADTDNLKVGDVVRYKAWDKTQIDNLSDGTDYIIASMQACDADPESACYKITLKKQIRDGVFEDVTFGTITLDQDNPYTPIHSLTKTVEIDGADYPIFGLKEGIPYFVVKIDKDHLKLANSIDEANEIANGVDLGKPSDVGIVGHVFDLGVTNGIGIRANLSVSESSSAGSWYNQDRTATNFLIAKITEKAIEVAKAGGSKIVDLIKKALGKTENKAPEVKDQATDKAKNNISLAGGLAVSVGVNSVKAEVGSTAELSSTQDIEVLSMLSHEYTSSVEAEASPSSDAGSTASLGIAISSVVIADSNKALIDGGAVLNAKRDLNVKAATNYPSLARATLLQIQQAGIGDIAGVIWESSQSTSFVFAPSFFNGFVRSTAAGNESSNDPTKVGVAGSMGFVYLDSATLARIDDNVRINQDTTYHTDFQNVEINSSASASLIHMAGNFAFNYQPGLDPEKKLESVKKYLKELPGSAFTPFGNDGSKKGVGGSVYVPILIFENTAEIGNGVNIRIGKNGKLSVIADTQVDNFSFVQAGSQATDGFAVAGAISYVGIFNTTTARIAPTAKIVGGSVSVSADDHTNNYNLLGSLALGTDIGVGVSIGVNTIMRDVYAIVGNYENGQMGPWQIDFINATEAKPIAMTIVPYFDGDGNLSVQTDGAVDTKEIQIISIEPDAVESFTLTFNGNTTAALSKDSNAKAIETALNGLSSISSVGGVTVTDGENGGWEITFNTIGYKGLITGTVVDIAIIEEGAENTSEVQLFDTGHATQGGYRLNFNGEKTDPLPWNADEHAIESALNELTSIRSLKSDDSGAVSVMHDPNTDIFSITFNVFEDVDFIGFEPLELYDGSYDVKVIQPGNDQSQAIFGNSHSGGFTLIYNGESTGILPYDATVGQIKAALDAIVPGGVTVKGLNFTGSDGTINIPKALTIDADAGGDNWVFAVAGAATKDSTPTPDKGATNSNGMPRKHWQKTILVDMKLAGQNFPKGGSSSIDQNQKTTKNAFAVAGTILVNIQIDKVYAILRDTGLVTASNVNLSAVNATNLRVAAGSAALATNGSKISAGVAGAVSFNWVEGITGAIVENVKFGSSTENATVKPTEVTVEAQRSGDIFALAAGAAGAPKEKGIAFAGSVAINILKNMTEAKVCRLQNDSEINGDLKIHAEDASQILGNAGAISYGGKAGVGPAFAINLILNQTNASFDNSDLKFNGDIDLSAKADNSIIAVAGAVGSSKGDAGVGGTIAVNLLLNSVQAEIAGSHAISIASPSTVIVRAENVSTIYSVGGAIGAAKKAGVGIAIAFNFIQPTVKAWIIDSQLDIGDINNSATTDASALTVFATNSGEIHSISAGGAGAEKIAVAGGISVNIILSDVQAYISGETTVIRATGDIIVSAQGTNNIYALSGNAAGAGKAAVGAALSYNQNESKVFAYIDGATVESINGNIFIDAQTAGEMIAIAAGGAFSGKVAVDGSVVIGLLNNKIWAFAENGAKFNAAGSVGINAADTISAVLVAGVAGGAGSAAVGVSNSTFVSHNEVLAYTGSNVVVKGKGKKAVVKTLDADFVTPGSWKEINSRGVFVNAVSDHAIRIFAVGGLGAGKVAVAASGTVSVVNDTVKAFIGETSTVEASNDDSEDDLSSDPLTVSVLAGGKTTMWGVAGALSGAGTVGVGAGLDVAVLTKAVKAYINGKVISEGDILVQALAREQLISVSASIGGGGTVGVAGSVGTYTLNLDTFAWVGSEADLWAQGSVLVSAYDSTNAVLTAGSISGAGTVGVGASIEVSVTNKDIKAYIDQNAVVNAVGNGNGLVAFSGSYSETYVEDNTPPNVDNNVQIERQTFDLSAVNSNEDTIDLGSSHSYQTGQALVYSSGKDAEGNLFDAVGGLEDGLTYYVIVDPLNPNKIRLATDYLNAKEGIFIQLDPAVANGSTHSLWDGQIDKFDAKFKLPGISYSDDLNHDGLEDADPHQDPLTKKRTTEPGQLRFKGIAVTAINQDNLLTFSISAGGAGTVAVNIDGLVNVINVVVDAHIGENAKINQKADLNLNSNNSVYVLAGNDFFHIGVVPAANGSGTVAVVPAADVMIIVNNISAVIADGAEVRAKQNVILDANSHEQIISVVAGVSGSGLVSVGSSVAVVVINNKTVAAIGDEDNDMIGATIYTDGNMLINASDETHVILVAGNLAIGGGAAGVGAGISVMTIAKYTGAYITPFSIVNAKGNGNAILNKAYQKTMDENGAFSTYTEARGVIVQAYSDANVITIVGAGAGGFYAGIAGAVLVNVFRSDTDAYIGASALVNQDRDTANNMQDVLVTALNHSKVFNFAGSVGGGIAGVAGAVEVNVVRNNARAYIGGNAKVTASNNVQVTALSNEDNTVVAATLGAGAVGASLNILVNIFGSEFTTHYQASYSENERDENGSLKSNEYKQTINEDPLAQNGNSGPDRINGEIDGVSGQKDALGDFLGKYDSINRSGNADTDYTYLSGTNMNQTSNTLKEKDIKDSAQAAINAQDAAARSGTVASIGSKATIIAETGNIDVTARQRIKFLAIGGSVATGGGSFGAVTDITVIGSNVEAYVQPEAKLTAGSDINILSSLTSDVQSHAVAGNVSASDSIGAQVTVVYDHAGQRAAFGDNETTDLGTIAKAKNLTISASSDRKIKMDASGAAAGAMAAGASIAVSIVDGQTLALMGKADFESSITTGNLTVKALSLLDTQTWATNLSGGAGGSLGAAVAVNTVNSTTEATVRGSIIGLSSDLLEAIAISAISQVKADVKVIGANVGAVAAGLNVGVANINPIITARIDGSDLYVKNLAIKTFYNYAEDSSKLDQGAIVFSAGGSAGAVGIQGTIATVHSAVKVTNQMNNVRITPVTMINLISRANNKMEAKAIGATGGSIAATVNMSLAENAGSEYVVKIVGLCYFNAPSSDTQIVPFMIDNMVAERAYAETIAAGVGLIAAGGLNLSIAVLNPTVRSILEDSTLYTSKGLISAQYDGDASAKAIGVSVALPVFGASYSLGVSVAVSDSTPMIEASVSGLSDSAGGEITIEARQNLNSDGTKVDSGASSEASSSGGAMFSGTGAIAIANNKPVIKTFIENSGKLEFGTVSINALSYNKSYAKTFGINIGGIAGVGASVSRATSGGSVEAWLDSDIGLSTVDNTVYTLNIVAKADEDAYAESLSGTGGIVSGSGSSAKSYTQMTVKAEIRGNHDVRVVNDINVSAVAAPKSIALAKGVNAAGLAVGASEAWATTEPKVTASVSGTIFTKNLGILAQKTQQANFDNGNATAWASLGSLIGINATISEAVDYSVIKALVVTNSNLNISGLLMFSAINTGKQTAKAQNQVAVGLILATGGSIAKAISDTVTEALFGNTVKVEGNGSIEISAFASDNNTAEASAGGGGAIAGSSTRSLTDSKGTTTAGLGTTNNINMFSFVISSTHIATGNTNLNSLTIGVISGNGVYATNTVDSTVLNKIGDGTTVIAKLITMTANNRTDLSDKQSGTTGGIISGAGAYSDTEIALITRVDIGPAVKLSTNYYDKSSLQLLLAANNVVNADNTVTFTTGGALSGVRSTNTISAKILLAEVLIGSGSQLISNGVMDISARGSGRLNGTSDLETFGAGTVMSGGTLVEVYPVNQIIISGGGTKLQAQNNLTLAAGRSSDSALVNVADNYYAHARLDGFAGSAFPIDGTSAEAYVIQSNLVQIDSGATIRSGNQLNLYAESNDLVDLLAKAKVVSWISKAADGLSNLFSNNSTELFTGDSLAEAHAKIIMNGIAETGFNRDQQIKFDNLKIKVHVTFNITKNIYTIDMEQTSYSVGTPINIGDIDYVLGVSSVNSPLIDALHDAQKMLADFGDTNATLREFYTAEIARIQTQLASLYPSQEVNGTIFSATSEAITITIPQIIAAAGRIDIRTGILQGNGNFIAPGNSKVEIINNTQAFLNLQGILIPDDNGGVYLNTVRLGTDNSAISQSNASEVARLNRFNHPNVDPQAIAGTAAFTLPQPPEGSYVPSIRIENTLNIANYYPNVVNQNDVPLTFEQLKTFKTMLIWPDITLLSSLNNGSGIINPNGSVDIITFTGGKSTVRILNTIRSQIQNIISGGDVYVEGLTSYSVGGETSDILNNSTGYYSIDICGTSPNLYYCTQWHTTGGGLGNIRVLDYENYLNSTGSSTLFGDRISIRAEYININGTIQSGRDNYTLSITEETWSEALNLMRTKQGRIYLPIASGKNPGFSVYYNTISRQFETDPIKSSGGYVELFGKILSTGQGQIKVLGGYPTVQITNSTNINVLLGGIDLSLAGAGTLVMNDYSGGTPALDSSQIDSKTDNKTYVSIFNRDANQIQVKTSGSKDTSRTVCVTGSTIAYNPDASWYYGWTTVQTTTSTRYAYIKRAKWLDWIPDVIQIEDEEWSSWSSSQPRYGGNGPYYFTDDNPRADLVNSFSSNETYNSGTLLVWSHTYWTWYGSKVYEATYKQVTGTLSIYTHEVNAHRPISISFIGSEKGSISINSTGKGDVILEGDLLNPSGPVIVNAAQNGIYQTDEPGSIVAENIMLTAGSSIGTVSVPISLQLSGNSGLLKAAAANGGIFLKHLSGDLQIDTINAPNGNVDITAAGSILAAAGKSGLITANGITLNAGAGIGTDIHAPIQINSNTSNRNGKVNITAKENIYLSEISGDLNLEKMITNGDVWLKVVNGNLVDTNKLQTRDERTYQELLDTVYTRLRLMDETGAQVKIDHLCQSLVVIKTQEYRTYWQYRLMQTNPSVYDSTVVVNLTAAETVWYTDFYWQQGTDIGLTGEDLKIFVNNALQTLINTRTEQYRSLHVNYGNLGDSFDPDYQYSLSQTEMDTMKAGVKVWTQAELLQLISGNLLKPVSSTMTDIEDPNIVARNVTLEVSGTIGSYKSTPVILPVVDGKLGALTDDQKVALAAAERSDIVYVGPAVDAVSFSLSNNQIKLTAPSGTNWQQLGFTAAGMEVHLRNIYLNWLVASEQETWKVESVNGSELTLSIQKTISPYITYFINLSTVDVISNIIDPGYYLSAENSDLQYAKITALNIYSRDDINIDSNGMINAKAGNGIYLGGGKEMQGDLNLAVIQSLNNGEIRIRSHRNVINSAVTPQTTANVITGGDVVLEAGGGSIGESDKPVYTAISGDGILTARADKNVYISQVQLENGSPILNDAHPYLTAGNAPDLKISNIYAQTGEIVIRTDGLILDGEKTDFTKLLAKHIILTAGKGIGESDDPLEVHTYFSADQPGNGWLKATALNHVNLSDPEGDMGVLNVLSYEGNVNLSALNSILDAGDLEDPYNPISDIETESVGGRWPKANIIAENVTLETTLGGIGTADNELDIDSSNSSDDGRLTASTGNLLNTYLIETVGDMNLNTVTTGMDVIAFITAPAGSILNGAAAGVFNIVSGKTKLFAAKNIGTVNNKLTSEVGWLEGTATDGGVWIYNNGTLVLSSITGSGPAVHGKGDIEIISGCPETIATDIISDSGSIKIWAKDDDGAVDESGNVLPDDLTVKSGVTLRTVAEGTFILLSAGDDLIIEEGASLIAAGDIILRADANTIDASGELNSAIDAVNTDHDPDRGAIVELHGTYIVGADNRVYVQTYDDNDIINLYASLRSRVTTGAGNNQIRFFGSSTLIDGGVIDGGSGIDMLDYTGYDRGINIRLTDAGTIDGFKGSEPSISGGFDNIDSFNGSIFIDILSGTDENSVWTFNADDTVNYVSNSSSISLNGFEKLISGSGNDRFIFRNGSSFSGEIITNSGTDTIDFSGETGAINVELVGIGTTDGFKGSVYNIVDYFDNVDVLIGTTTFEDILKGLDIPSTWMLSSENGGSYEASGRTLKINNIEYLMGGTDTDTYIFREGISFFGNLDGGSGMDRLDNSDLSTSVILTLTDIGETDGFDGNASNISYQKFANINQIFGGTGSDNLNGLNELSIWSILAGSQEQYSSNDRILGYNGIENLQGGSASDSFLFYGTEIHFGLIDAGTGYDTLDYSLYENPVQVKLNNNTQSGFAGNASGISTGFVSVDRVIGSDGSDVFYGTDNASIWNLVETDSGYYTSNDQRLDFTAIESLKGGSDSDLLIIADSVIYTGIIDGGSGINTLDYHLVSKSLVFTLTTESETTGYNGIETTLACSFDNINVIIGGSGYDSLAGLDVDSLWDFLVNGHTIYSSGGSILDVSGIECLNGGNADDDFKLEPEAFYSGTINGGDGVNWLDYSAYTTPVDANLTTLTVPGLQPESFSNIYNLIGGSADDVLTGNDRDNRLFGGSGNDDLYGLDGNDILNGGRGSDRMFGGKGNDIFVFIGDEQIEDQIDGGAGLNTLDFSGSNSGISILLNGIGNVIGFSGTQDGLIGSFTNINDLIGSGFEDFLFGLNDQSVWEIGDGTNRYLALNRNLIFRDVENLRGGSGVDIFRFLDGGVFGCSIDGGPNENNRLDFSLYTTPVYIDLSTDTYSVIHGTVTNVQRITGGKSNDTLIGNDLPNVIDGGPGDDLIRGLGGNDFLITRGGNNIVYGDDGNDFISAGTGFNILYGGNGYDIADIDWPGGFHIPLGDIELVITHKPGSDGAIKPPRILVIDIISLQVADISSDEYDAFLVRLASLDQVLIYRGTAQKIILDTEEDSGGNLPERTTVVKAMTVKLLRNGIQIKVGSSLFLLSFVLPLDANPDLYAIFFWDEDLKVWIEIPAAYVIDSSNGGIGRLEAWVRRTGKYVLILRGN